MASLTVERCGKEVVIHHAGLVSIGGSGVVILSIDQARQFAQSLLQLCDAPLSALARVKVPDWRDDATGICTE